MPHNLLLSFFTYTAMAKNNLFLIFFLGTALSLQAQSPAKKDSTALKTGYAKGISGLITGSVDQVTEQQLNKGLNINALSALNGQSAGVSVSTGPNQEAMLNAVRVRGTTSLTGGNDPLVIIDGVSSDLATLSTIYPADIERFTILKDASETAQYGSRGASGVIEVTTKKGKGERFHISYDGNVGWEAVYKRVGMLSGSEFRQAAANLGMTIADHGGDTDFRRSIERTGWVQNHHVAFGGGSDQSNYRTSVGVMEHRMVVKENAYRNYIAKLDITQKAFDERLSVDLGIFGSIQKSKPIPFPWRLFYSAAAFNPTFSNGLNAGGGWDQVPEASWITNPNSLLKMENDKDDGHFNAHLRMSMDLGRGLSVTAFGSYSYNTGNLSHYYPTFVWSHGEAYRGDDKSEDMLANLSINYRTGRGAHQLELLGLAEVQHSVGKGFHTQVSNFTTDAFGYHNLAAGAVRLWEGTGSYYQDSHMESFLAHAQYVLANRYILSLNARADGSSKVGRNNRWGFFPSVSGAWVIDKEPWMQPLRQISKLKLRMGYGVSGNLGGIDAYISQQSVMPNGVVSVGGTPTTTLGIIRNANPDLKWEIKRTFNVGLDMGFWNNRVVLTADYYTSHTSNMLYLYDASVPPFIYDKVLANLGSMRNSGLEIGFGITPLRTKDMELSVNMNMAFARDKLVSLNGYFNGEYLTTPDIKGIAALGGAGFHGASDAVFQMVGQPLGVFYLPHCKGLIRNDDGSYRYDVTKEKYICGQATPKATLGSNIAFRYKAFDVTMQTNGAFGHKIYNGTALTYMNMLSLPNYNVMKGAPQKNIQDQTISDYWLERGDYLNIDYLTLGWTVPVKTTYIRSLRLSLSVNNLATITGYSGLTPMINSSVIDGTLGLDDKRNYPVYRSYAFGLSIKF